jgi:hypothetical protein
MVAANATAILKDINFSVSLPSSAPSTFARTAPTAVCDAFLTARVNRLLSEKPARALDVPLRENVGNKVNDRKTTLVRKTLRAAAFG